MIKNLQEAVERNEQAHVSLRTSTQAKPKGQFLTPNFGLSQVVPESDIAKGPRLGAGKYKGTPEDQEEELVKLKRRQLPQKGREMIPSESDSEMEGCLDRRVPFVRLKPFQGRS